MNLKNILLKYAQTVRNFIIFLVRRVQSDSVLRVASSLSYTSLIALVPVLAIALAIFSAFPVFGDVREQVKDLIIQNLMPDAGQDISFYFDQFISAAGKLTTIGVVGLALTAVLLLSTIENSFNFIFKVTRPRRFTTKITLYWTVITLGPLLLGTAFSLKGYVALSDAVASYPQVGVILGGVLPFMLTWLLLTCVYVFVPNKKVNFIYALGGGFVAMCLFWVLRTGFAMFMVKNNTYKTLYGAVAAVPLTLVWMYLSWAAVIFGAVFTAALEEFNLTLSEKKVYLKEKKVLAKRTKTEHK